MDCRGLRTPTLAWCASVALLGCGARSSLESAWLSEAGGSALGGSTGAGGARIESSAGASDGGRSAGGRAASGGTSAVGGSSASGAGGAGGAAEPATAIAAGQEHACAVRAGRVYCWGWNSYGQLGDGTTVDRATPVAVVGLPGPTSTVSVGNVHSCALVSGEVYCWGFNSHGQLGTGTSLTAQSNPMRVQGLPPVVASLATGLGFTAAVAGGIVYQWGDLLGEPTSDGSVRSSAVPVVVAGFPGESGPDITMISAGAEHACALRRGRVYCWGRNLYGQLGDGTTAASASPLLVEGIANVSQVFAGWGNTCAVVDGAAWCWGDNHFGQVSLPAAGTQARPKLVGGLSFGVTSIAMGQSRGCAMQNGATLCWGNVETAVIQNDVFVGSSVPPLLFGPAGAGGTAISTQQINACFIQSGLVWCWGFNQLGQLGNGSGPASATPVLVRFP